MMFPTNYITSHPCLLKSVEIKYKTTHKKVEWTKIYDESKMYHVIPAVQQNLKPTNFIGYIGC